MRPEQRRDRIVDLLREGAPVSVELLATELTASRETVRRDLATLAPARPDPQIPWRRQPARNRGGECLPNPGGEHPREKRAVARPGGRTVRPGRHALRRHRDDDSGVRRGVGAGHRPDGGHQLRDHRAAASAAAATGLSWLAASTGTKPRRHWVRWPSTRSHAFMPGTPFSPSVQSSPAGVMDFDLGETEVARAMIAQAQTVTVIADASKLGRRGLFEVCPLARIDRLVVDAPATATCSRPAAGRGRGHRGRAARGSADGSGLTLPDPAQPLADQAIDGWRRHLCGRGDDPRRQSRDLQHQLAADGLGQAARVRSTGITNAPGPPITQSR